MGTDAGVAGPEFQGWFNREGIVETTILDFHAEEDTRLSNHPGSPGCRTRIGPDRHRADARPHRPRMLHHSRAGHRW
jgi:hypothetical protein